jgi:hypothetical protein
MNYLSFFILGMTILLLSLVLSASKENFTSSDINICESNTVILEQNQNNIMNLMYFHNGILENTSFRNYLLNYYKDNNNDVNKLRERITELFDAPDNSPITISNQAGGAVQINNILYEKRPEPVSSDSLNGEQMYNIAICALDSLLTEMKEEFDIEIPGFDTIESYTLKLDTFISHVLINEPVFTGKILPFNLSVTNDNKLNKLQGMVNNMDSKLNNIVDTF